MPTQVPQDRRVPAHARRNRPIQDAIDLVIVHATRGDAPATAQFAATVNWFVAAPDLGGWGPTADALAGARGETAVFSRQGDAGEYRTRHGSFSAGYGARGASQEYSADERGYAIEIAQSAALEDYTDAAIAAAADLARPIVQAHNVPLVRIPYWSQLRTAAVPRGFIGHEDTANGRRTGKSDPGPKFPWERFFALVADPAAGATYTVRRGDTLGAIAIRHGITVTEIVRWNGITDPNRIEVGQVLRVSAQAPAAPTPPPAGQAALDAARAAGRAEGREAGLGEGYQEGYTAAASYLDVRLGLVGIQVQSVRDEARRRAASPPARG